MLSNMKFSVIIPARNEEKNVADAIASLKKQTISRDSYEIIVVDNDSSDATAQVARDAGADRVVTEKKKGTNIARQRGVEGSTGEIVAFLDADCIAPPQWLETIEKDIRGCAAVSGPYDYRFLGIKKILNVVVGDHIYPLIPLVLKLIFRRPAGMIIGGNFAVQRQALEKIGGLPLIEFWGDDATTAMIISRKAGRVRYIRTIKVRTLPPRTGHSPLGALVRYARAYFSAYFSRTHK